MPERKSHSSWNYSRKAIAQFGLEHEGRRLITRDSPISGGVYYGTYGGEAIVVDPEKYPNEYKKLYQEAAVLATVDGGIQRSRVLKAVFDTVKKNMPYSQPGVDAVLEGIAKKAGLSHFPDGQKVELSSFISHRKGVCRHQALTAAALLEMFKTEGYIRGKISVDRNKRWRPDGDRDGHAWARYTTKNGEVYILDIAQDFFGSLEDSRHKARWNYFRPEEKASFTTRGIGDAVMPPQIASAQRPG